MTGFASQSHFPICPEKIETTCEYQRESRVTGRGSRVNTLDETSVLQETPGTNYTISRALRPKKGPIPTLGLWRIQVNSASFGATDTRISG